MSQKILLPIKQFSQKMQREMVELCEPFLARLNLTFFAQIRYYQNGTLSVLSNNMGWLDYWEQQKYKSYVLLPERRVKLGQFYICPWQEFFIGDKEVLKTIIDARELGNFDHALMITTVHHGYFESFAFGAHPNNDRAMTIYFNYIEQFLSYTQEFKLQAKNLIKQAEANRLILPKNLQADNLSLLSNELKIIHDNIKITSKEWEALKYLCEFHSMKRVALHLRKSPRTIEMHINNLRHKLGYRSKDELIQDFRKNKSLKILD
jgi:DNA-binding CsgD family transcriptional regulator